MTTGGRRLKRDERRALLLERATQVFAEKGYRGTTLDDVAARAGVTKPVLYDHFGSKEALLTEVLRAIRAELLGAGEQALIPEGRAEERIRRAVLAFFTYAEARPQALRVLLNAARGEAALERVTAEIQAEVTEALVALLAPLLPPGMSEAERLRFRLRVELVKQGLHGLSQWWLEQAEPRPSREELADVVMEVMWEGLAGSFAHLPQKK